MSLLQILLAKTPCDRDDAEKALRDQCATLPHWGDVFLTFLDNGAYLRHSEAQAEQCEITSADFDFNRQRCG